jgi:hypothetical protein
MTPGPDLHHDNSSPGAALPCIIDIEASGFGRGSYPIEIGLVMADGASFCTLISPPPHWSHWDGQAERVHGLSRSLIERHGRSPREVATELNQRLRGQLIYCDGWAHDYAWLARLFDEAGQVPEFKLCHLNELLDEHQAGAWDAACDAARRHLALPRHRASSDARVLQLAFEQVRQLRPAG